MREEFFDHYQSILDECIRIKDKCQDFVDFSDQEFPRLQALTEKAQNACSKTKRILHIDVLRRSRHQFARKIFLALKRHRNLASRRQYIKNRMIYVFKTF